MVAAPFKATLQFKTASGKMESYRCTVSDVNGEYYVFQDGNNDIVLPSNLGVLNLFDVILSASGTDTSQAEVYVNGKNTGVVINNPACVSTAYHRQFMGVPMPIAPAARLRIKQVT
jgi:hypothetical protein